MKNIFKRLFVPSGSKEIVAYKSWIVRWSSANFSYTTSYARIVDESEIFPSKEDAEIFANALKQAFKITKCNNTSISIQENQTKLMTTS